jgi:thymidylate synthase
MQIISARNVNEALLLGLHAVNEYGVLRDSRVGPVMVFQTPVTTIYENPTERVVFFPERDANPFFHFMEGLWMIAGRNDVEWISRFNSSIVQFSDNGRDFHGAYGYRWRKHFGFDQLDTIAYLLRLNPDDRRIVLQMWDPKVDLARAGKDFPCNTSIKFRINDGRLDMTVENRSNDMIWGAYGANAVHFSMLQEFMAGWIGVPVGHYWQISTNFHAYVNVMEKHSSLLGLSPGFDDYSLGNVEPYPMIDCDIETWQRELNMFINDGPIIGFQSKFFKRVAIPMLMAWQAFKAKQHDNAIDILMDNCEAKDWRKAAVEWIRRRAG